MHSLAYSDANKMYINAPDKKSVKFLYGLIFKRESSKITSKEFSGRQSTRDTELSMKTTWPLKETRFYGQLKT